MTETALLDWLTIAEAATAIRCSERTVERLAAARKLEQRLRPQRGSPDVAVFSPQSVAEEAARRHPAPAPFVLPRVQTGNGNGHSRKIDLPIPEHQNSSLALPAGDDPIRQLFAAALRAVLSPPLPPVAVTLAERQVLTLDEAATASGWTRAYLRQKIKAGTLPAEKDRAWKIRRKDLEQL